MTWTIAWTLIWCQGFACYAIYNEWSTAPGTPMSLLFFSTISTIGTSILLYVDNDYRKVRDMKNAIDVSKIDPKAIPDEWVTMNRHI